jgi:hypothetical protein
MFDFSELEEVEAALCRKGANVQGTHVASLRPLDVEDEALAVPACVTPGAAAADSVAKTLAAAASSSHTSNSEAENPAEERPLEKLSMTLQPDSASKKALFLIDWDDTLCPTTWIEMRPDLKRSMMQSPTTRRQRTGEAWEKLDEQATAVAELLHTAATLGQVVLVTLAQRPWVNVSIREFMPGVGDEVSRLDVFYARENAGPPGSLFGCPWTAMKRRAMEQAVCSRLGNCEWDSLISIGDSEVERRAAQDLGRELQSQGTIKWTKTVKLAEHPSVMQLTSQVRALNAQLVGLAEHPGHRNVDCREWMNK